MAPRNGPHARAVDSVPGAQHLIMQALICDAAAKGALNRIDQVVDVARMLRAAIITGERDLAKLAAELMRVAEAATLNTSRYEAASSRMLGKGLKIGGVDMGDRVADEWLSDDGEDEAKEGA